MANQKYVFLQALIIAFVIFNIGIFLGYKLETSRIDKINNWYLQSEIELLDQRIQKDAFEFLELNCDAMVEENINFADRIYEEAMIINKYEKANRINDDIILQHKRYDLLRTLFWINSMKIKEKCNSDYHNLVYFYQYNDVSIEKKAKQKVFSNLLFQIKEEKKAEIMLIPIAADNNIGSINLLLDKYNITELPTILIDEKIKLTAIGGVEDIREHLD
ncbi:hypothetical protein KAT80_00525 [Candidatus Pacearchaeota archaeon]|nr:hypothetical protein [Candidatus Pacearchaeota archaeon]